VKNKNMRKGESFMKKDLCLNETDVKMDSKTGLPDSTLTKPKKEKVEGETEENFFKYFYIPGRRKDVPNTDGVIEQNGKIQIADTEYNLDCVYGIIINMKEMLVKGKHDLEKKRDVIECTCYMDPDEKPFTGTSGRKCIPDPYSRRNTDDVFCRDCLNNIAIAMIRTDKDGNFILKDKKPIIIAFRAKRIMQILQLRDYLKTFYSLDLEPIIKPVTLRSKEHEKKNFNIKRFVTKIAIGSRSSKDFGDKIVFDYERGIELSIDKAITVIKFGDKTEEKFNEKFNMAKRYQTQTQTKEPENSYVSFDDTTVIAEEIKEHEPELQNQGNEFDLDEFVF